MKVNRIIPHCGAQHSGTDHKAWFIDEALAAGRAMSGLAESFTLVKYKATGFAAGRFYAQALRAMMQTFPNMFEMRHNLFFGEPHLCGNVFGRDRPLAENSDNRLTDRLGHGLSLFSTVVSAVLRRTTITPAGASEVQDTAEFRGPALHA
jgi:hypothetical protein